MISGKISLSETEVNDNKPVVFAQREITQEVYRCKDCWTVYDSKFGDLEQGISKSTSWDSLPNEYKCPICENPKSKFELVSGLLAVD